MILIKHIGAKYIGHKECKTLFSKTRAFVFGIAQEL
jgi:hypothetical protein